MSREPQISVEELEVLDWKRMANVDSDREQQVRGEPKFVEVGLRYGLQEVVDGNGKLACDLSDNERELRRR